MKKTYLESIPLRFGVCLLFYCFFWLYCTTTATPFIERSEDWSLRSGRVLDQLQQECHFFSLKFKSAANFSAPAQEGNLFFLSGRSARKKIHNFPIKSSHLWQTSRHVRLPTNLHYDNLHLHNGCKGGNDTSTRLLHCEKMSPCTRCVSANCHNAN